MSLKLHYLLHLSQNVHCRSEIESFTRLLLSVADLSAEATINLVIHKLCVRFNDRASGNSHRTLRFRVHVLRSLFIIFRWHSRMFPFYIPRTAHCLRGSWRDSRPRSWDNARVGGSEVHQTGHDIRFFPQTRLRRWFSC